MSESTIVSTSVSTEVEKLVAAGSENIVSSVAKLIADNEIEKRTGALTSAITTQQRNRRDLAALKPDQISYNADGSVKDEGYSASRLAQRKSVQERIDKLEGIISAAVNEKNWDELLKFTGYNY